MAGTSMGASAPVSPSSVLAPQRIPATTRTRRLHAVFPLGDNLATVHSTRREVETRGVIVTLSDGAQWLGVGMLPAQARAMARTLLDAAEEVELSQRHSRGSGNGAGAALVQEGGAV